MVVANRGALLKGTFSSFSSSISYLIPFHYGHQWVMARYPCPTLSGKALFSMLMYVFEASKLFSMSTLSRVSRDFQQKPPNSFPSWHRWKYPYRDGVHLQAGR